MVMQGGTLWEWDLYLSTQQLKYKLAKLILKLTVVNMISKAILIFSRIWTLILLRSV